MVKKQYNIAILGATGNVGRLLLEILEQRNFPYSSIKLLASERSAGQTIISPSGIKHKILKAEPSVFERVDIVFASAGSKSSKKFAPEIIKRGGVIIDNSSAFRMDPKVPLVVPQVNGEDVKQHQGIIANPNCSTAPLVLALKPLDTKFGLKRVVVSTYQSVSGAGKAAMDELKLASEKSLRGEEHTYQHYTHPIAFNLIPQIDVFMDNGYTKEEMKLINESRKMLHKPNLAITCTAVRVPVLISHSESVNIEFERQVDLNTIRQIFSEHEDIVLEDNPSQNIFPTPLAISGQDPVYIGRLRYDESKLNSINLWLVSDNLRIGAALNTVKIGEELIK